MELKKELNYPRLKYLASYFIGIILIFGKDDVHKAEGNCLIHHEYIDCPECNEKMQLSDGDYFSY